MSVIHYNVIIVMAKPVSTTAAYCLAEELPLPLRNVYYFLLLVITASCLRIEFYFLHFRYLNCILRNKQVQIFRMNSRPISSTVGKETGKCRKRW